MVSAPSSSTSNRNHPAAEIGGIAALALAHDLQVMNAAIDHEANRLRKCRGECAPASPWRRMRIRDVQQQRRQRGVRRSGSLPGRPQFIAISADEGGGRFARCKSGMPQAGQQKSLVGGNAESLGLFEAANQLAARFITGRAVADQLGDHGIVEWRNLRAGLQGVLDPNPARHLPQRHPAGLRHEVQRRILRTQPHLDRMPGEGDVVLLQSKRLAAGDAQLQFDQIEPGDRFGDGMLHLQACVHFHEIEGAAAIEQEFQRAGALHSRSTGPP